MALLRRFALLLFVLLVLAFLWLPSLTLYGNALIEVLWHTPSRWREMLPLDPLPRALLWNTLSLAVLTALLSFVFGIIVAIALARGPKYLRGVGLVLCALPLALPPTLPASAYLEWSRTPPARALASLGADQPMPFSPLLISALVLAGCYYPLVALPVWVALRGIPSEIEDAARLFGNSAQTWIKVLWPLIRPAALAGSGLCAALAMWEMGAPDLLDARTYSVWIYRQLNAQTGLDPRGIAVQATLAAMPLLALGSLALWPIVRRPKYFERGVNTAPLSTTREGWFCSAVAVFIWALCPLAPIWVFARQLTPLSILSRVWSSNDVELNNTIGLATVGTVSIILFALILILGWRWWPSLRRLVMPFAIAPLLVPPVLLGIALIYFYNRPQFALIYGGLPLTGNYWLDWLSDNSSRYAMMLIGYMARFLPMAIWLLDEAERRLDTSLGDAAQNLGATPTCTALTIWLPLLAPTLLGVGGLLWALCASELTTSVLINAPGGQTLPVPIFNLMHIGSTAEVAALSLTLFALSAGAMLGLVGIATLWLRWRKTRL
jgi:iron(III) transport system permease protein